MLARSRFILWINLLGAVIVVPSMSAQAQYRVTRAPAELLAAYVRERQSLDAKPSASLDISHVLTHYTEYPRADVESLLRGLEELALTGEPPRLRAEAAVRLSVPGSSRRSYPLPGTFARLERVYRGTKDPLVRSVVVSAMSDLAEQREAVAFLERLATKQEGDFAGVAGRAMASLLMLGDEGRATLRRMHESGAVHDQEAKADLAILAKNGYRLPK
jgi:hypothetical protein